MLRIGFALAAVSSALVLAACSLIEKPVPPLPPTPEPRGVFDGTGDDLTPVFDLTEGLLVLTLNHQGVLNFIVEIVSETGKSELIIYHTGLYNGTRVHRVLKEASETGLKPGSHRIRVQTISSWHIEVSQPQWTTGQQAPVKWTGTGDAMVGPMVLPTELVRLWLNHNGSRTFNVRLISVDARYEELLVNTAGHYDRASFIRSQQDSRVGVGAGVYVLAIQADGVWLARLD